MVQGNGEGESPQDGTGQEVGSFGETDDAHQVYSGSGANCPQVTCVFSKVFFTIKANEMRLFLLSNYFFLHKPERARLWTF